MKKLLLLLCTLTLLLCGCGKDDKNTTTSAASSDDSWTFSSSPDEDKSEWDTVCSTLKNDLQNMEHIEKVEIEPENYDTYKEQKKATITCYVENNTSPDEEIKKGINDYVKSMNYFDDYSIVYE
ncbi:MAG: hypothetical protein NC225_08780 [Clostridium sp.]|nr:hypothetical protein [Clostridium sp.]MCM1460112.1 hypothetical protein [Bacteroides sp.]